MKQRLLLFFILLSGAVWSQQTPPRPNPPRLVNDLSGLLTPDQVLHLEEKLVAYDDSTSIQIAVVIVNTLNDYDPVDYAVKLGRDWGVGNKKTNNGVIFLVSTEPERRKVFIAPGYGLEGALPDIICKQIVEGVVIPEFKQENYYRGLSNGVDAIIKASRGEYKAPKGYRDKGKDGGGGAFLGILVVVIIILMMSRGGGPKGGMMSRRGFRSIGALPFIFPGGGGGGGGWSGGGGGGGFGGFGGGSFGGGGAGGSW